MKLIGLVGAARVGKDTAAEHLVEQYDFSQYAFADPIKEMLEPVFGDLFYGGHREEEIKWLGKSPRQLMQTLGTEWGRDQVHPNLWVLLAEQAWQREKSRGGCGFVVSDVRFANECEWITRAGGTLIEIVRPDAPTVADHRSEREALNLLGRWRITNDGTLEDLYARLDEIMEVQFGR